jgi:flagellar biosynthesis GTPase FlhF
VLAVSVEVHRRALLLLDGLCAALVDRGHEVALDRKKDEAGGITARFVLTVSGVALEAALVERLDRRERSRTKAEEERARILGTLGGKPAGPVYEQFACGRLQLTIGGLGAWRSSWSDGKTPLERHLGNVVVALESESERRRLQRETEEQQRADAERQKREQEAEAERRRLEREAEKRKQEELEAQRQHQHALEKDLRQMARRWSEANEIRAFLGAVDLALPSADRPEDVRAWLRWAAGYATTLDPLSNPQEIPKVMELRLAEPGLDASTHDGPR